MSLRARFLARLEALYPDAHAQIAKAQAMPKGIALLALPWRIGLAEARARLAEDGIAAEVLGEAPPALFVPAAMRAQAVRHALVEAGALYPLGLASLAVATLLAPAAGMRVLDACAAPGGKTLALAAMMQGKGEIIAIERVRARFYKLKGVLARAGAPNVHVRLGDARRLAPRLGAFDAVLVDAPCSTEARLNPEDPESFRYWSERKIAECARKQKGIVLAAARALASGGRLVYATCSHAPEENEAVLDFLLARMPMLRMQAIAVPFGLAAQPGLRRALGRSYAGAVVKAARILPGARNEAMFVACLRKED